MNNKLSYKEIINKYGYVIVTITGESMVPLLRERSDSVKLVKLDRPLTKGDVICYKRSDNTNVLHRIVRIIRKKDEVKYVLCGDNQVILEKYIYPNQIIGVMEGYFKDETYYDINDKEYIKYYKKIIRSRIFRLIKYYFNKIIKKPND